MDWYAVVVNSDGLVCVGAVNTRGKKGPPSNGETEVHLAAFVCGGYWPFPLQWAWVRNEQLFASCDAALIRAGEMARERAKQHTEMADNFEKVRRSDLGYGFDRYHEGRGEVV